MSEIAEDMLDGSCCSICGQYFQHPKDKDAIYTHDYPVACKECWEPKCGYQKADVKTI